mmetsp:Transcript_23853/g.36140  ORF Transcript_23853/g.36140 Transcript_23853/m.36140 type:complete len:485 (+) Transcript_23853:45-1499(+)
MQTETTTASTTTTTTMAFDETIDNLSRSTQSLLRTMRLDVVLLGSQQDESRCTLSKLEQDWEMLQKLLEEQAAKDKREEEEEEALKKNKEREQQQNNRNDDSDKKQQERKAPFRQFRRHSSIEWSEDGLSLDGKDEQTNTNEQVEQQAATRTLNLSDYSNPNSSSNDKSTRTGLDHSNFDWGAAYDDNNDMEEEDRKADQSGPMTLDSMLNQAKHNEVESGREGDGDDLPPIKRIFGWGRDKQRDDKVPTTPTTTQSEPGPSFFGRRGNNKKQQQEGGDDAASTITVGTTTSSSRNSFSWQTLFRWDGSNRSGGGGGMIDEKLPSNNSTTIPSSTEEEKDLSDEIYTMQVKLRGCDSAASSLQQLVSYQKRQLTDLQHEKNRLKVLSEYETLHAQSELKSLQAQVEAAQVERERKISMLKDAEKCRSIFIDKEEKLKEELECIRMELFMLNMQLESTGDGHDDDELEEQNQKKVVFMDRRHSSV